MGTVDAVVEVMFMRIVGDLRVKSIFEGESIDHLQGHMREYLAKLCGGPDSNTPNPLAGSALSDTQFDAFCGHLQAALNTLEVPQQIAAMVMGMIYAGRE